jgi:hypothetical protein
MAITKGRSGITGRANAHTSSHYLILRIRIIFRGATTGTVISLQGTPRKQPSDFIIYHANVNLMDLSRRLAGIYGLGRDILISLLSKALLGLITIIGRFTFSITTHGRLIIDHLKKNPDTFTIYKRTRIPWNTILIY